MQLDATLSKSDNNAEIENHQQQRQQQRQQEHQQQLPRQQNLPQHENPPQFFHHLEQVIEEAWSSLKAHSGVDSLQHREQFFQFVRSLFLVSQALAFSPVQHKDRQVATVCGERARVLYEEYCRQLSEWDFQPDVRINLKKMGGDIRKVLRDTVVDFGLLLEIEDPATQAGSAVKMRETEGVTSKGDGHFDDREITHVNKGKLLHQKQEKTSMTSEDFNNMPPTQQTQPLSARDVELETSMSCKTVDDVAEPSRDTAWSCISFKSTPYQGQEEVGLPIDPEVNSIPTYDVPLSIFQSLCGCKVARQAQLADEIKNEDDAPFGHEPQRNALEDGRSGENAQDRCCLNRPTTTNPGISRHPYDPVPESEIQHSPDENGSQDNLQNLADVDHAHKLLREDPHCHPLREDCPSHPLQLAFKAESACSPLLPVENKSHDSGYSSITLVDTALSTRMSSMSLFTYDLQHQSQAASTESGFDISEATDKIPVHSLSTQPKPGLKDGKPDKISPGDGAGAAKVNADPGKDGDLAMQTTAPCTEAAKRECYRLSRGWGGPRKLLVS